MRHRAFGSARAVVFSAGSTAREAPARLQWLRRSGRGCPGAVARAGRLAVPGGQIHRLPRAGWTFGRLRRAVMVRWRGTTRPFGRIDLDLLLLGMGRRAE